MVGIRRAGGRLIALEGPSAVGKTRVAEALAARLGGRLVPEAFRRLTPPPSLRLTGRGPLLRLERRLLAEEMRRYREAERGRRRGDTVVLDTGFLGPLTYAIGLTQMDPRCDVTAPLLRELARRSRAGALRLPDLTVYLNAPRTELARRARSDPRGHPPALVRRHWAVARTEGTLWRALARRLPSGRVRFVRARGSPSRLAQRIASALARFPPPPPGPGELGPLLRALERSAPATVKSRGRSARPPR